jgi:8-oxo-dGTP pyrophosphatase MutT (NUDIX family)
MRRYNDASFPPLGRWDPRLSKIACPGLLPIETLHENPWFSVRSRGGYFTLEYHLHQVTVLPVVNDDSVAMVRVKRPVIDDITLELPAGAIEKDEDPAFAALRELAEEAGIVISETSRCVAMPPIAVSSARMPKLSYVFRIDVSEQEFAERQSHDDEIFCVERIPVRRLSNMMMNGEVYVSTALAILGVFLCSRGLDERRPYLQR